MTRLTSLWSEQLGRLTREHALVGASLFRLLCGVGLLYQLLINYHQRYYLFGPDGVWPFDAFIGKLQTAGGFSVYALSQNPALFEVIYHLGIAFTLLWTLGWRTRLTTVLVYVHVWSLHERNPSLWDGGDNALQLLLFYAIFANLGAHFTLFGPAKPEPTQPGGLRSVVADARAVAHNIAILAIAIQLCLIYGTAGLYKVQGEIWQSGVAMYYILRVQEFTLPGVSEQIYLNAPLVVAMSYLTVAFQVGYTFMVALNRYARLLAVVMGIGFHLGIAYLMGLITFSTFMIAAELVLISDREYAALRHCASKMIAQATRGTSGLLRVTRRLLRTIPALQ
ncbi:MAG: HTTM domain-containing protein [Thermoflexales bacterium]